MALCVRNQFTAFGPGFARYFADHDIHAFRWAGQGFDGDPCHFTHEGALLFQCAAGVHFQVQDRHDSSLISAGGRSQCAHDAPRLNRDKHAMI